NTRGRSGEVDFVPEPTAYCAVSDCRVVQDDQDRYYAAEAVNEKIALWSYASYATCRFSFLDGECIRASGRDPSYGVRMISVC
ncbi:MAG: hypothetical protein WBX19_07715, partial [Terracidiphilus sp.]